MQSSDLVLIQRCVIFSVINGKSTIGNTIGVTTNNTYSCRMMNTHVSIPVYVYTNLLKSQANQIEDCIGWSVKWISFLICLFPTCIHTSSQPRIMSLGTPCLSFTQRFYQICVKIACLKIQNRSVLQ